MNPEDPRQRASDLFDESDRPSESPMFDVSEDWEMWKSIATHLQGDGAVAVPADFSGRVQNAIRRARLWNDAMLVIKVGAVTALVLMLVVTNALGIDWWQRIVGAANPAQLTAWAQSTVTRAAGAFSTLAPLWRIGARSWPFIPTLFVILAIAVAITEFAIFRVFRLGPFSPKGGLDTTSN